MIRTLGKMALTLGALVLLTGSAFAQGPGLGMGGGPFVLMAPNVQKELKLSDEQVSKVREVLPEIRMKHMDEMMAIRDLPEEERPAKMRALMKTMNEEAKKELSLTEEQTHRLGQIQLQASALMAFGDPKVQSKLMLTEDQRGKFRDLGEDMRERGAEIRSSAGGDQQEAMKKFMALRKETMEKALGMLTADQKKAWTELTGKPVEINMPAFRRPNN